MVLFNRQQRSGIRASMRIRGMRTWVAALIGLILVGAIIVIVSLQSTRAKADGIDSFVTLMLHMDGTDGSTTFTDSSASTHTVATTGASQIDTAQSQFGGASGQFDGTTDTLSVTHATDFDFAGDFTIDLWMRHNDTDGELIDGLNDSFNLFLDSGTDIIFLAPGGGPPTIELTCASAVTANTWYHVAAVRSGTTITLYVNGTSCASGTYGSTINSTGVHMGTYVGGGGLWDYLGHIDELRVSKGVARWTSNFTPPSAAYSVTVPSAPTLYNDDGGSTQITFNNARQSTTTPTFRVSALSDTSFDRFQIQLATTSDFSSQTYAQTFSSTYASGTAYNLLANSLSPSLPTTDDTTYYVRVRASADSGSTWSNWSTDNNPVWSFTYKASGDVDWYQTTGVQFDTGTHDETSASNGSVAISPIEATGGTITESGGDVIHTFTSGGTFAVTAGSGEVEYLIVGGGGGGGKATDAARSGGGGGAGGMRQGTTTVTVSSYSVVVGAGGDGSAGVGDTGAEVATMRNGATSSFASIEAIGGGGGGNGGGGYGADGGSGGGSGRNATSVRGLGTAGQGNNGGFGAAGTTDISGGGGGGGAGGAGADGTTSVGGAGGVGVQSSITGTPTWYAGGGGGARFEGSGGSGGTGGGGAGNSGGGDGTAGTANTGGGGGGAVSNGNGGNGGSGIVVVRYSASSTTATGTLTSTAIDFDWQANSTSWGAFDWSEDETDGSIVVRLLYTSGTTCDSVVPNAALSGNEAGFSSGPINISGLNTTTYNELCLQAVLTDSGGSPLLEDWSVSWSDVTIPTVTSNAASSVTGTTVTLNGNITDTGNETGAGTQHGFAYSTNATLSSGVSTTTLGTYSGTGTFNEGISSLSPDTTYYFRAYAVNSAGTSTGSILSFTTNAAPTVVSSAASSVTGSTATLNGDITDTGNETGAGTQHGFAWGTNATLSGGDTATTTLGTYAGTGAFNEGVSSLSASTTYYFRAYAANSVGTSTGAIQSFTTDGPPLVTTNAATGVGYVNATLNGDITDTGRSSVTQHGFTWGTVPTLSGGDTATTTLGSADAGAFLEAVSDLTADNTYYFRAYAVNAVGTSTGAILNFTSTVIPPTLRLQNVRLNDGRLN